MPMMTPIARAVAVLALSLAFAGCGRVREEQASRFDAAANLARSVAIDISSLKSSDGQPLLLELQPKIPPPRPPQPESLPETNALHWYDMEYAGWDAEKINIPASPRDGAIGKRVIAIINGDHPYLTAYSAGMRKVAEAYSMQLRVLSPNWKMDVQNQMLEEAVNDRPDMVILIPLDAKVAVQQVRKVNTAGVPIILSNMHPDHQALKYAICWTGPDDWGQFRMLARAWADKLGKRGAVAYVRHAPGGSPFFARTFAPVSELASYAPDIKVLDMQAPGFEAARTQQVVADWLTRFGRELTGICAADDSAQAIGIAEACRKAGRSDIVVVAAGNSKIGMDAVKAGDIYAITYQSAEADGAVALKAAADWFNGLELQPVRYLPKHIITQADVDRFMPAQW
ncbi:MAG: sugar ABC transporter substrate-binding protein [Kiritimatiellae bacterium]|nr:sugar ABC transporter substrate-binding protein [Kiritimatiellia bacterium]